MQARAFNPQIFLEFLCYLVFGGLLVYLVGSGKYLSYVTPRMAPYLYFTAIIMGIWALAGLGRLFRPQHRVRSAHCFVLAVPILLLLLPHKPLSLSDLSGNYIGRAILSGRSAVNAASGVNAPAGGVPTGSPTGDGTAPASASAGGPSTGTPAPAAGPSGSTAAAVPDSQANEADYEYSTDLPGLDVAHKRITVANDDFSMWLSEMYANMEKYQGFTLVMTGYVFKDPKTLKADEFITARPMMSCCAADLAPAGLVCKYDKAAELKADSWVTVEGTLFIGQADYQGEKYDDPQLNITKVTPAAEVEGYVYPY